MDGVEVGHLQIGGYGHTLGAAVGIGFVSLDEPVSPILVQNGNWLIDVAGQAIPASASIKPMLDPSMERIKS
ncbi:glycine cleavage T C-terminal barrel domain-containing protein [Parasedimentitalea denitrificans]|uniref:glycine cleavage T C-terminal barrel domain-containing protein n=1 Tax=Parasedimentitalea denitrificans TaxID=2211118 RepID=UPI0034E2C4B6